MSAGICPECDRPLGAVGTVTLTINSEQVLARLREVRPVPRSVPLMQDNPVHPGRTGQEVLSDWYHDIKPALPFVLGLLWLVTLAILTGVAR